jgi:transmembrane sensor
MTDDQKAIPEDIRAKAVDWWLRQNDRALSRKGRRAFEAWLTESELHRLAFDKVSGVCGFLGTKLPGASRAPRAERTRRRLAGAAGAVALLLLFQHDILLFFRSDQATGAGETRLITLADGSRIELDAKSAIAIHYAASERRVALIEGEAWFQVAPDAARPFVVEAGGGAITALGTAFDVALEGNAVQVVVGEHRVKLESGGADVVIGEGERSGFTKGVKALAPGKVDVAAATAWRRGRLVFSDTPLGEVVTALARHHRGYVAFLDPSLKARRVTGVFLADNPLAAFDEIEAALGLRFTRLSNYLILIHK